MVSCFAPALAHKWDLAATKHTHDLILRTSPKIL